MDRINWPGVFSCVARILLIVLGHVGLVTAQEAQQPWRTWSSSGGGTIEARVVTKDSVRVTLEKHDNTRLTIPLGQLSRQDQEFLAADRPAGARPNAAGELQGATSINGIDAKPGEASAEIPCKDVPKCSYFLYLPKSFHTGRSWPVMFIMSPGGGSPDVLARYVPGADQLGIILAVSTQSKNGENNGSEAAINAMVKDVYTRVPVIKSLSFASGFSGGSREAYSLAEREKNIKGVLACGSGAGFAPENGQFRQAKLNRDLVVCSLMGTNCFNRREAVASHKRFNKATSRIIWFVGGHDWAEAPIITEGMAFVYGHALIKNNDLTVATLRTAYAEAQLAWAKTQAALAPWISWNWAENLRKYPASGTITQQAGELADRLAKDDKVKLSVTADKVIDAFTDKYLSDNNTTVDKSPDPKRVADANKKAAAFPALPHAELLKKLAEPAS